MINLLPVDRSRRVVFIVSGLFLLLIPLLVPLPTIARDSPVLNLLGDRAHVLIFAALAWLLHTVGPLRGRPVACAIAAAAIGGASEFIQQFVGRSPLLDDWLLDLVGIGLTMTWIQWRRGHRRTTLAAAILLLTFLAYTMRDAPRTFRAMVDVRRSFPVLSDFTSRDEVVLWRARDNCTRGLIDVGAPHGQVLRVTTVASDPWPGVTAGRLPADWTGYQELVLDARLQAPSPDSLRFALRLDDFAGRDDHQWASLSYTITHQWRTLRFPLRDLATDQGDRKLERDDIFSLTAFLVRPQVPAVFEIDNVRLVSPAPIDNGGAAH